jgi:YwiC-like protein
MSPSAAVVHAASGSSPAERPAWRKVAMPSEHGGWGLTLEPPLLALLVAPSRAGVAIAVAALLAFLARTPVKLVLVDLGRRRRLPRTRLAAVVGAVELTLIGGLVLAAIAAAGGGWLVPVLVGLPLLVVELWYDARSRGRRLVPELAGAVGIGATAAAIVVAGGGAWQLGVALWAILAGCALVSIPYVRAQVLRLRRGVPMSGVTVALQLVGVVVAAAAVVVDRAVVAGAVGVALIAVVQAPTVRRPVPPPKILGLRQLAFGLALVAVTAAGAHLAG